MKTTHASLPSSMILLAGALFGGWSCGPPSESERARAIYEERCALCHGVNGDGLGEAAYLLQPKPRRFRNGLFRIVSTENRFPTREDLFRTITNGMPGTGMPSWAHLPEEDRWLLVDYVLELDRQGWHEMAVTEMGRSEEEARTYAVEMTTPGEPFSIPPEPPTTEASLEEGERLYTLACGQCHGEGGDGMRKPEWTTNEGFPTWSRNLREGVYKGGREAEELYLRFAIGLPGTPMPAQALTGEQLWPIVHYVQSLSDPEAQERAWIRTQEITANRVTSLPSSPDDGAWQESVDVRVPLMPLWWRENYVDAVRVKALHDGERVALRIEWNDETADESGARQGLFPDGVAVELSAGDSPPLFAMGAAESPINIWHWKGLWRDDEFEDVGTAFPHMVVDDYYGSEEGWEAAPMADPLYRPAAELDNYLAQAERPAAAEDANAAGLGTLSSQSFDQQDVEAVPDRSEDRWRVQFVRNLETSGDDVPLAPGASVSVAFAVWDGSGGDRNGQKTVSIWNTLVLE